MKFSLHFRFDPRDCWIGVYWNYDHLPWEFRVLSIYVCLIPCFPLRLQWSEV